MADLFDDIERVTVMGSSADGIPRPVCCWQYNDLAVAQNPSVGNLWVVLSISTGSMLPFGFEQIEPAISAMKEIFHIKNRWVPLDGGSMLTEDQSKKIREVADKNGATWFKAVEDREGRLMNGYESDNDD